MVERLRAVVLRTLRVPAEPEPPPGDPTTLRVFRASPAFFRLKLAAWAAAQIATLVGLVVGLLLLDRFGWFDEGWIGMALSVAEVVAWLGFLSQIPLGLAGLRLDYEFRWYMLSDRALRIREGVVNVRERTMTFANIQQISVRQGPLQRLLGLADIEVRTAGGGGSGSENGRGDDLHRGYLKGVEDAEAIRDVIRERVRRYRDSGLGDPGEPGGATIPSRTMDGAARGGAVAAARDLLEAVRALRSDAERASTA
jgi:membrane protein YdbS with pleckstrin-like domain